jgi:hypothetical protein
VRVEGAEEKSDFGITIITNISDEILAAEN